MNRQQKRKIVIKQYIEQEEELRTAIITHLPVNKCNQLSIKISKCKERVLRYMYNRDKHGALKALERYKKLAYSISADVIDPDKRNEMPHYVNTIDCDDFGGGVATTKKAEDGIKEALDQIMTMIKWFEHEIAIT